MFSTNHVFPCQHVSVVDNVFPSDVAGLTKIQAVWRGYRCRKQNVAPLKDLAISRYQRMFNIMKERMTDMSLALQRVR